MSVIAVPIYHMRNLPELFARWYAARPGDILPFKLWRGDAPDVEIELKGWYRPGHLTFQSRPGCDVWEFLREFMGIVATPQTVILSRDESYDDDPGVALDLYSNGWPRMDVYW